jgi:hypothetical protein
VGVVRTEPRWTYDPQLLLPWTAVLKATHALHGSPLLAQRLWYTTPFAGAGLAMLAFLAVLGFHALPSLIGTVAYLLSP